MLAGLVGLIGEFAKFIYYERLARRIPDEKLAGRARFLKWAFTITLGVAVMAAGILLVVGLVAPGGGGPAGGGPAAAFAAGFACLLAPAAVALLVFGIMTLFLLLRLRKAIAEQARLARTTWAAALGQGPVPRP